MKDRKIDLNLKEQFNLTRIQALMLLGINEEEAILLKARPIEELSLVEAIAVQRKTEYANSQKKKAQLTNSLKN